MKKILAADIGATNSRFGHFEAGPDGQLRLVDVKWYKTASFSAFPHLLRNLTETGFSLDPAAAQIAVFAIAGPVEKGERSAPPFIAWDVRLEEFRALFPTVRPFLINDFVAQAYACRSPLGGAAVQVLSGTVVPDAAAAVIGAGTALGKAALVPAGGGRFLAVPSEGGHASFPFETDDECRYADFLRKARGEASITGNIVVSGLGISYVHEFLTGQKHTPAEIASGFSQDSETLRWIARFYGRVCRNFALEVLALGGVYIAGGVAAKSPAIVKHPAFAEEFRCSATLAHLLAEIPVMLISDENSGVWGAAFLGKQELERES